MRPPLINDRELQRIKVLAWVLDENPAEWLRDTV